MGQREKDVWREIIDLYRDLPCLWKTNHDHYFNKDMRSQAMLLLFEKYKTFDQDATLSSFKKKLENMRSSYQRERKKITNSTQTGASSDSVYVPLLWYYELFTFLDEKDIAARNGIDTEIFGDEDVHLEFPAAKKKKISSSYQKKKEQLLDATCKIINTKEDDWEIIGRSFGVQLRDLTPNQKLIARKLISDVIFYGSTEQLTYNSYVANLSPSVMSSPLPTSVPLPLSPLHFDFNQNYCTPQSPQTLTHSSTSSQNNNKENMYVPLSPLTPTSQNISLSNVKNVIMKCGTKPSSTINSSLVTPTNSPLPTSAPFPATSSQYKKTMDILESPLPPTSQNLSPSNIPKIILKCHPKSSSTTTSSLITTTHSPSNKSVPFHRTSSQYENTIDLPQSPLLPSRNYPKITIKHEQRKSKNSTYSKK